MQLLLITFLDSLIRSLPDFIKNKLKSSPTMLSLHKRFIAYRNYLHGRLVAKNDTIQKHRGYGVNLHHTSNFLRSLPPADLPLMVTILCDAVNAKDLERTVSSLNKVLDQIECAQFIVSDKDYKTLTDEISCCAISLSVKSEIIGVKKICDEHLSTPTLVIFLGDEVNEFFVRAIHYFASHQTDVAYCDVDKQNEKCERGAAEFYPDWNPELQLSTGYINDAVWLSKPSDFFCADEFELNREAILSWMMRLAIRDVNNYSIIHIPIVLVTQDIAKRPLLNRAVGKVWCDSAHLANWRYAEFGKIISINWQRPYEPLVSIIIPTKNAHELVKVCIESIVHRTNYKNWEIILVDNLSDDSESLNYFKCLSDNGTVKLIHYPRAFNYSAINNFAIEQSSGEYVLLLNNDIEVISPDWLDYMLGHAMRDDIGCVGARLLFPNDTVQHAGVVMGYGGGAGHAHKFFHESDSGYLLRAKATNCFSAVTAACLLVSKEDFINVGGLDEDNFSIAFNDVDLCLKIASLGKRNVFCAEALLYHHESVSRGFDEHGEAAARFAKEVYALKLKWKNIIAEDPAYNLNLTLTAENFAVIDEPRLSNHISHFKNCERC